MKAAIASNFGSPDDVLVVVDAHPKPKLKDDTGDKLLIRVHAVSLSPSDYRTLLGQKTIVANPSFPYIPGGDVSGIVQAPVPSSLQDEYKVGDRVVATWNMYGTGGLAQYTLVDVKYTVKLPPSLTFVEGAALANSAAHALKVVELAGSVSGQRVLVLGGSGGVGSTVVQLLRTNGASFIAATSTDEPLLKEIAYVDRVIDYKREHWWQMPEFQQNPFDVVIDCAEGRQGWYKCGSVVKGKKDGGRWVAVIMQDWHIDGQHFYQLLSLLLPPLGRTLLNFTRRSTPEYRIYLETIDAKKMEPAVTMAANQELKVVIDPRGPFPFTTQGVRDAFNLHIARGGHGKIVIEIN